MKVWLITWEWMAEAAAVADRIAAVIDSRRSRDFVLDFTEYLYALATSNVRELRSYAAHRKNNPYRAKAGEVINGVPHGDRILCGDHPWLYGRPVTDFLVSYDPETLIETVSWVEPPRFKWNAAQTAIEPDGEGRRETLTRLVSGRLSREYVWDRSLGSVRPEFRDAWNAGSR